MTPKSHIILREILAGRPAANRYATLATWLGQTPWKLPKPKNEPSTSLMVRMLQHFIRVNGSSTTAAVMLHAAVMMVKELETDEQEELLKRLDRLL